MGVNYQPIKGRYLYMFILNPTGLLYETQEVGKATAVELAKQREQLEKTSHQLDEINSTLRFSQRHLTGLKSVFGGLKNSCRPGTTEQSYKYREKHTL